MPPPLAPSCGPSPLSPKSYFGAVTRFAYLTQSIYVQRSHTKRYCSRMKVSELLDEQAITRDSWTVLRNTHPAHVWICELLL
ncbi:hypothetical protein ACVWZZ_005985 [Bradyrhizobium sp. LM6.10]